MKQTKFKYWLLSASLLFSVFVFSGFNAHSNVSLPDIAHSEQLLTDCNSASNRIISFRVIFYKSICTEFLQSINRHDNGIGLNDSKLLTASVLTKIQQEPNFYISTNFFKTNLFFPESEDDEPNLLG